MPANVNIATQEIVQMAKDADPMGKRTLGVMRKPDRIKVPRMRSRCPRTWELRGWLVLGSRSSLRVSRVGAKWHRFSWQVCGSSETQALIHSSGNATWIMYTSSDEFPNPGNAERCGCCRVGLGCCLESVRAEVDEAAQSSHAEPTQEMSADLF